MMNERSSRAHSLLLLTVTQQQQQSRVSNNNNNSGGGGAVTAPGEHDTAAPIVVSQLCLADLGGSEKVKRSGASGERLHEAIFINKGLLALKSVVSTPARSKRHPGGATARHGSPRLTTARHLAALGLAPRLLAARRTRDEPLSSPRAQWSAPVRPQGPANVANPAASHTQARSTRSSTMSPSRTTSSRCCCALHSREAHRRTCCSLRAPKASTRPRHCRRFHLTILLSCHLTILPSYHLTIWPSYHLTVLPSYRLTVLRSYRLTILSAYRLTILPRAAGTALW